MPTFLMISRHSPENCPAFNEKARTATMNLMAKLPELLEKHGVKLVGSWVAGWEHINYMVAEAPSIEAFRNFGYEPEVFATGAFDTMEIKIVMTMEESMKQMQELLK